MITKIEIIGRIVYDGHVHDHVLGTAEAEEYGELALQVEQLLVEIADTWPEVVAEGVLS